MISLYFSLLQPIQPEAILDAVNNFTKFAELTQTTCLVEGGLEYGFQLRVWEADEAVTQSIWEKLRRRFGFYCGYVQVDDGFRGCTTNWPPLLLPSSL